LLQLIEVGKEDTPLPFCFTCNKVIQTVEEMMFHASHKTGKKSWRQMYDEAMHDTGGNRP